MAHFNQTSHTANGAFANSGIRHGLGEILVPSAQNELSANINTDNEVAVQELKYNKQVAIAEKERKLAIDF